MSGKGDDPPRAGDGGGDPAAGSGAGADPAGSGAGDDPAARGSAGDDRTGGSGEGGDPTAEVPARIRPGGRADVGLPIWGFSRVAGRVAGTGPPALFLTLGRNRRLFWGWLRFAGRLMPGGRLPRRETELIILRVAYLSGCAYEFSHHVRLGRRAGVRSADVRRVLEGAGAQDWSERERALMAAVDMLHERRDLDDATWGRLREHLDEPSAIEFLLLVGHYQMLATTITTLRLEPDPERSHRWPRNRRDRRTRPARRRSRHSQSRQER